MEISDDIQSFVFRDDTRPDKQPVVESMSESRSGADVSEHPHQDARQRPGYPVAGGYDTQISLLQALSDTPSGMRIIAGPTGSGQSTPLRTACRTLITEDSDGHS